MWTKVWSPKIEFESLSDAQYAYRAAFSPSGARSNTRWGKLIIRRVIGFAMGQVNPSGVE